jgi:hypothetical protein
MKSALSILTELQQQQPSVGGESDLDSDPDSETITIVYRDDDDEVLAEVEFTVAAETAVRIHWWMIAQGIKTV